MEASAVEAEDMDIQLHETPTREEPEAVGPETVEIHSSETPHDLEETQVAVQPAAAVTGPETRAEDTEASPSAVNEQPVFPVEPLVAVDAIALATTLIEDDKELDVSPPQKSAHVVQQSPADEAESASSADVTLEKLPSARTQGDSDVEVHEVDSAAVHSAASSADVQHVEPASDVLSVGKSEEVERPRSPWTPSYSVTTQGPGELNVIENVVQPEEQDDIPLPTKESTPEIVIGQVDGEDPAEESGSGPASHAKVKRNDDEVSTQEAESNQEGLAVEVSQTLLELQCVLTELCSLSRRWRLIFQL